MCVLGGSQMVRRLPPALVAEAAARTAFLKCARCSVVFLCWSLGMSCERPYCLVVYFVLLGMSLGPPSHGTQTAQPPQDRTTGQAEMADGVDLGAPDCRPQ
jgi:hypothetical protein